MKIRRPKFVVSLTVLAGACVFFAPAAWSCGDFRKPTTHFDGVDEYGHVAYWDQIGELQLGDGNSLPLIIGFRSDWESMTPSPHLGSGWLFGLLDARFVQRSQEAYDMISIDGYTVPFGRDAKNPAILNGAQGWKAEIKGEAITVWASCGWRLEFVKGKIASLTTPKNRVIQIRREQGGLVSEVVESTNILLKVVKNASGQVTGLALGDGQKIELQQVEKPLIQSINGVNVVGAKANALGKIILPSGKTVSFDYAPFGDSLQPAMKVISSDKQPRLITWDPLTRFIITDGHWKYQITPSERSGQNAVIARTNTANGEKEFWHYDAANGKEVVQKLDGTQIITSWFTSGKLAGALRKREEVANGKTKTTYMASYDEKGNLFREVLENGDINQFTYNDSGQKLLQTQLADGKPVYTIDYKEGRISTVRSEDGRTHQYFYDDKGREVKMMIDGKIHFEKTYAQDGTWEKEVVFDREGATPSRTFYREFDARGRVALDKITEHSGEYPEINRRYFYDALGQLEKQIDSQQGTILYFDDVAGERIAKLLE